MFYVQKLIPIAKIRPNPKNARTHSGKQIRQIANSIQAFGFTVPVLIDERGFLIAGHGRWEAAHLLGLTSVPAIVIEGLSDAQKRALQLADNRIAQSAGWDRARLASELTELPELLIEFGLDTSITGFEPAEIDALHADFDDGSTADPSDDIDPDLLKGPTVTRRGDCWALGKHGLLCGDARSEDDLRRVLGGELAHMAFQDPPYNVQIKGIVGRGVTKHGEFAMASGEMSSDAYVSFLRETLGAAAEVSIEGAVHFICMDWRHIESLVNAGRAVYGDMLNLVVWAKSNAGQGSFYRSQHELIGVFRVGSSPHLNTIELGKHGRNRSNVWHYAGANTFRAGRMDDLKAHPTVKPVAMVADAIRDCTRRDQVVLDSFAGSGSTILAAERVGRRGCGVEIDPQYVDVAIRRWQSLTGKDATLVGSTSTFEEVGLQRAKEKDSSPSHVVRRRARR
jgi:DNA modification methylase